MKRSEALQQRKKLLKLVEEWTRSEIMARFGRFDNLEFGDYAQIQVDKKDEIRRLIFGTDDLLVLGARWEMLKEKGRRKKKERQKNG